MRILLSVIFYFFAALIVIENSVVNLLNHFKKPAKRIRKTATLLLFPFKLLFELILIIQSLFTSIVKKIKRRRKRPFSLPFRTKIKYFALGVLFACLFVFPPFIVLVFLQDLPTPQELTFRQIPQTTKIFDRNGKLLAEVYAQQ